jgi:ABC-2 type transport system permease protein
VTTVSRSSRRSALLAFMRKEVQHILRDRQTLTILLLLPVAQLLLFGFAVRTDVRDVRIAIIDTAPDAASMMLRNRFAGSGRFRVTHVLPSGAALAPLFRRGAIDVALQIAPGLGHRISDGQPVRLELVADAMDPNTGTTMRRYAQAVVTAWQAEVAPTTGRIQLQSQVRMRFNPTLESVNLFVPGLIALILTLVTTLMTAISLSREKERGTFEVLLVSPLRPWQIVVGKVAPYLALAFLNVLSVLLAARLVFHVPMRGSVGLLLAASVLFSTVGLALGTVIASVTSSQLAAMLAALGGTMLPNLMLSGMIFPLASMPMPLQIVSNIVPARWFVEICRSIMLKGSGLPILWQELAILSAMLLVLMAIAIRRLQVRLD